MEVDAAEGGADSAGTSARQARRAGAWNRHDDAAVAGILAAAKAAGATGAAIRYGEMVTTMVIAIPTVIGKRTRTILMSMT